MSRHQTNTTAKSSDFPITLGEAKDHLRVVGTETDAYVQSLIEAATEHCERRLSRPLRSSHTITQKYGCWPEDPVGFDWQPVLAISSVTYYDDNDASQTVSAGNYRLHPSTNAAAYLEWDDDFDQPSHASRDDAVTITYTAGYSDVPMAARHAIKLLIGHWFEHGEAVKEGAFAEMPMAVDALLAGLDWGCYR